MQNAVSIYNFNENQVRTQLINNEPWFCLSDCCKVLNIKNQQTSVKLPENGVGKTYLIDSMGREQQATFINEPNLYRLIFRSNKPQAQAFADWVYNEVLPSIRKTGGYGSPAQLDTKAIGGIVKKCCAVAVREELAKMFDAAPAGDDKTGYGLNELNFGQWRLNTVMAVDAMKALYTRLYAENEMLKQKLLTIKQTVN